jgi:2,3-bisphosphoglycerate-dependent phosphoglycerate mutase
VNQVLYLVRHCQATGQEPDAPLTEIGRQQAIALADRFGEVPIERIISSPFVRALQSIKPLSTRLGLEVERDERLIERALSSVPLDNWRELLAETFADLDLSFEGGESSRTAMMRGVEVARQAVEKSTKPTVLVTHGNLMTLILRHFDDQIGFDVWDSLQNPDVFCVKLNNDEISVRRMAQ